MQPISGDPELGKQNKTQQNSIKKLQNFRKLKIKQHLKNDLGKKRKRAFLQELEELEFCKDIESDGVTKKQQRQICHTLVHGISLCFCVIYLSTVLSTYSRFYVCEMLLMPIKVTLHPYIRI